jgi:hypothetical protein
MAHTHATVQPKVQVVRSQALLASSFPGRGAPKRAAQRVRWRAPRSKQQAAGGHGAAVALKTTAPLTPGTFSHFYHHAGSPAHLQFQPSFPTVLLFAKTGQEARAYMVAFTLARLVQQAAQVAADSGRAAAANPRTRKAALELTDAAAARIRELLSQRHKVRGAHAIAPGLRRGQGWLSADARRGAALLGPRPRPRCAWLPPGVPQAGCQEARLQRSELHAQLRRWAERDSSGRAAPGHHVLVCRGGASGGGACSDSS